MAQLDNDQRQQTCTRGPKTGSDSGRTLHENRRNHLLSSACSCSSSSCCCSSSCCSNASSSTSANVLDEDERHSKQTRPKRGQYLGRRRRQRHEQQQGLIGVAGNDMQSELPRSSARTRNDPASNVLNHASRDTCRSRRSQLDRQLSDSSGIGAQLMNVLRINDDLSSSSSSARFPTTSTNMLMGHPQQQQQQQQELDTRSLTLATSTTTMNSAAATTVTVAPPTSSAYEQHNHQEQVLLTRGNPQVPLVVVSPVPPLQVSPPIPHYHHQSLYLPSQDATSFYGQHHPAAVAPQSPYSMYPVMEPPMMHPHSFHDYHQHHHQNRHDESLGYPADLLALDDGQQQQQQQQQPSYADLDEEMARHQNKRRQQRQEQSGAALPEPVIQANNEQLVSNQSQHRPKHPSYYYQTDQMRPQQVFSDGATMKHDTTTLAALNSSLDHSQPHQRLGASADSQCRVGHGGGDLSSSVGLDVGQQSSQSPTEMEDELKVCEWRNCGNTFLDMNEFVRHLEERHVNLEPPERNRFFCMWHNCKRNNQEFNARYKLLIHMRVHSGEKPYLCNSESCKKSFSRLENLKIHMRSHTGEKPYKCQFENCIKSFTNSSDRIKHHKTHKDPKPYNCSHEGCTKRYTDPSSLRKHLRAHKRHNFGCSMNSSCESPIVADVLSKSRHHHQQQQQQQHSSAGCSFSASHLDQSVSQSTNHYRLAPDRNQHHQSNHYRQQHSSYDQFADEPPGQHQQTIETVQDHSQQELAGYLHADYDPSREFASVLFSPNELASETISIRDQNDPTGCVSEETNYYEHSNYERPYNQQQTAAPIGHEPNASSNNYYQPKEVSPNQDSGGRYLAPTAQARVSFSSRQRPSMSAGRFETRADLHERHQQLSKSWCGGSSIRAGHNQQSPFAQQQPARDQPQGSKMEFAQDFAGHLQPPKSRRRVEFDCVFQGGTNYNQNEVWMQNERVPANFQQQQMEDVHYEKGPNQQQHCQPTTSSNVDIRYNSNHQSQPQHQQQLTRSQQHAQLMRSMPADVNHFQSRGLQRFE